MSKRIALPTTEDIFIALLAISFMLAPVTAPMTSNTRMSSTVNDLDLVVKLPMMLEKALLMRSADSS